jgi:hypothetical protein
MKKLLFLIPLLFLSACSFSSIQWREFIQSNTGQQVWFDADLQRVAVIFDVDVSDFEKTSFEFTTPEQELYRVDGKKIKLSSAAPWKYHDEFAKDRYLDETRSYANGSFGGLSAYSHWNTACLFYQVLNTWNFTQSQIDFLNEKGFLEDWTELDYNLEIFCGDIQNAEKLSQHLDQIEIGDSLWWLVLAEKEKTEDHVAFFLKWNKTVKWTIKFYENFLRDELLVYFIPENISAKVFILSNMEWENYSINLFEWNIDFASFDAQTRQVLLWGDELKVELDITEFYHVGRFQSEFSSDIVIDDYEVILD